MKGSPFGVVVVVPSEHAGGKWRLTVDPYLVAAKMTEDAVLAYHTALEFHGRAYSVHWTCLRIGEQVASAHLSIA